MLSPQELSTLSSSTRPTDFADGLVYEGQVVYEVVERYKNEKKPFAVGDCFGTVVGGELDKIIDVDWAGDEEAVQKKKLRAAPPVGTRFFWQQDKEQKNEYVIGAYLDGDCVIWQYDPTASYAKPKRRRVSD